MLGQHQRMRTLQQVGELQAKEQKDQRVKHVADHGPYRGGLQAGAGGGILHNP